MNRWALMDMSRNHCLPANFFAYGSSPPPLKHFRISLVISQRRRLSVCSGSQFTPSPRERLLIALIAEHSIHLAIAVGTGLIVAHRLGLGAPLLEAWLRGEALSPYSHAPVRPILLIVVLILACSMLSNSSMLHPNRKQDTLAATAVASSRTRQALRGNRQVRFDSNHSLHADIFGGLVYCRRDWWRTRLAAISAFRDSPPPHPNFRGPENNC